MLYFIYIDFPEFFLCRELDFEFEMHIIYITQHNYFCTTFVFTSYFTHAILINFWEQEEYHIKSLPFNFEKKIMSICWEIVNIPTNFIIIFWCGNIPKLNHFLKKVTFVNFVSESRFKLCPCQFNHTATMANWSFIALKWCFVCCIFKANSPTSFDPCCLDWLIASTPLKLVALLNPNCPTSTNIYSS